MICGSFFRGSRRYIFDHSPFLEPYMLANSSIIFVLILMPMISVFCFFWRLIFCPENPSKVFTVSIMFFYGKGIYQVRKEDCVVCKLKVVDAQVFITNMKTFYLPFVWRLRPSITMMKRKRDSGSFCFRPRVA